MANAIAFNHNYTKLHGQSSGFLVWADVFHMDDTFPEETYIYDTDGKYPLEKGNDYIQLVFLGEKEIPFTTYRNLNEENKNKYFPHVGEVFEFNVFEETEV